MQHFSFNYHEYPVHYMLSDDNMIYINTTNLNNTFMEICPHMSFKEWMKLSDQTTPTYSEFVSLRYEINIANLIRYIDSNTWVNLNLAFLYFKESFDKEFREWNFKCYHHLEKILKSLLNCDNTLNQC